MLDLINRYKHECLPPPPVAPTGEIWQCLDCGKVYRSAIRSDQRCSHWRRIGWIGYLTRGIG